MSQTRGIAIAAVQAIDMQGQITPGFIRLPAILAAALTLGGCYSIPFEYAKLTSDNVEVTATGRGPVGFRPSGAGRIPYSYAVEEPGVSLSLTMQQWLGPNFELVSSVPIRSISTVNGYASSRSPFQYNFSWGMADPDDSRVGDVVEIKVDLEGRADPVLISGVIAESGAIRQLCLWACPRTGDRPNRPQRPIRYSTQQVAFRNEAAGITLAGTLTVPDPDIKRPLAAAVLVGSRAQDRDGNVAGHEPFRVLADNLTFRGFAVLRFDARGVGDSEPGAPGATSADFATDALAAVAFLGSHAEIAVDRIGLIGHGKGGAIAALAAAQSADVAFLVMLAPDTTGEKIDLQSVLGQVRQPVLVMIGERDVEVPARTNLPAIEAALRAGGNSDYTVREWPKLNHLFQTSPTGAISEYAELKETFDPQALMEMGSWILRRFQLIVGLNANNAEVR